MFILFSRIAMIKKASTIIISLSLSLIFLELILNIFIGKPWVGGQQYSSLYGWENRPNTSGRYFLEGKSYVKINSTGFNDNEHSVPKEKGTFRIAVLGDSYVEAIQVDRSDKFWNRLEKIANQKFRGNNIQKYEVMAFGVSGWGPLQQFLLLESEVLKYNPDLIIVLITTGNDIIDSSKVFDSVKNRPYFVKKDGSYQIDTSFKNVQNSLWRKDLGVIDNSSIYKWTRLCLSVVRNNIKSAVITPRQDDTLINHSYYAPVEDSNDWQAAWDASFEAYSRMIRLSGSTDKKILFVLGTNYDQLQNYNLMKDGILQRSHSHYTPNRYLIEFFQNRNVQYFDLIEHLNTELWSDQFRFMHGSYPKWQGHWNKFGHKVAADTLSQYLFSTNFIIR